MSLLNRCGAKFRSLGAVVLFGLVAACGGTDDGKDPVVNPSGQNIEAGSRAFMEDCTKPEDCESGICEVYRGKGKMLCSQACTVETQETACPFPSPGCNNKNVCKAP